MTLCVTQPVDAVSNTSLSTNQVGTNISLSTNQAGTNTSLSTNQAQEGYQWCMLSANSNSSLCSQRDILLYLCSLNLTEEHTSQYDDKGAMLYIVVVICIFAMGIALLIAAQMSYTPEGEAQVRHYLKHRSLIKDRAMMLYEMNKKRLEAANRVSVETGVDNKMLTDPILRVENELVKHTKRLPPLYRQFSLPETIRVTWPRRSAASGLLGRSPSCKRLKRRSKSLCTLDGA